MVMLRPPGKPQKIARDVLRKKGVKVPKAASLERVPLQTPYMQH